MSTHEAFCCETLEIMKTPAGPGSTAALVTFHIFIFLLQVLAALEPGVPVTSSQLAVRFDFPSSLSWVERIAVGDQEYKL